TGPLLRTTLLWLGPDDHMLLSTFQHIVTDDWSNRIFWRELSILYEAALAQRPSPLPELVLQYSDFAAWQRERLSGEVLEQELAYWTDRLSGLPPLELPTVDVDRVADRFTSDTVVS